MRIRIAGGRIVDPGNGVDAPGDVDIAGGVITREAHPPELEIDARGMIVCPGLVDLCARLREPGLEHKATIAGESLAAARGGITTVCMPPDTDPVVDTPAVVELIHQRAAQGGLARVEVMGALTRSLDGTHLAEMGALGLAGCVGVSNAQRPVPSTEMMRRALEYATNFGLTVLIQPEDPWLAEGRFVHESAISTRLGLAGIPETAETIALARDLLLVEQTGARAHFLHLSTARAVSMLAEAKARGLAVSADATIHHLQLTDQETSGFASEYHVRPPLRDGADRKALREGLREGVLDAVCSDHQPHERDARLNPFSATEPGISGLETLLALALRLVDDGVLSLPQCIASLTCGPARILGLDRGTLSEGAVADVCIFDPHESWTLQAGDMLSAGHNTPFLGQRLRGRVRRTLLGGRIVHDAAETR